MPKRIPPVIGMNFSACAKWGAIRNVWGVGPIERYGVFLRRGRGVRESVK